MSANEMIYLTTDRARLSSTKPESRSNLLRLCRRRVSDLSGQSIAEIEVEWGSRRGADVFGSRIEFFYLEGGGLTV